MSTIVSSSIDEIYYDLGTTQLHKLLRIFDIEYTVHKEHKLSRDEVIWLLSERVQMKVMKKKLQFHLEVVTNLTREELIEIFDNCV